MNTLRVLIFGAKGALGQELVDVFGREGNNVTALDRSHVDITDLSAVREVIHGGKHDVVINAAAWNDVDGAEEAENRDLAFVINGQVPGTMAEAAKNIGAIFVHYSTDYVFAGDNTDGYREDDEALPVSVYGESKLAGERLVAANGSDWYVCRVSKLYGRPGNSKNAKPSFLSIMLKLAAAHPELSIVDEEVGMPTYTVDVATATLQLLSDKQPSGVYHLVNEGEGVTWFGFAEELFAACGVTTPRVPVAADVFPKPAKRPKHAMLLNTRLPLLRSRREALEAYFREYPVRIPER